MYDAHELQVHFYDFQFIIRCILGDPGAYSRIGPKKSEGQTKNPWEQGLTGPVANGPASSGP